MNLAVLFVASTLAAAGAAPDCSSGVCVTKRKVSDGVSLSVSNTRKIDVWVELSFTDTANLFAPGEVRRKVAAGETEVIVRATLRNPAEPYRYRYRWTWSPGDPDALHDDAYLYLVPVHDDATLRLNPPRTSRPLFRADAGDEIRAAREGRVVEIRTAARPAAKTQIVTLLHADSTYAEYRFSGRAVVSEGATLRRRETLAVTTQRAIVELVVWRGRRRGGRESLPFRIDDGTPLGCLLGGHS